MTKANIPTPEELRKLLRYEPETGKLFWLERPISSFQNKRTGKTWNTRYAGKEAFTAIDGHGYRSGAVNGYSVRAHRVIFAITQGYWTNIDVDHKNGDRLDNRASNLREATRSQNLFNARIRGNNTSGYKGVSWCNTYKKWKASICFDKKQKSLGYFNNKAEAILAYRNAASALFGEFARLS